MNSYLLTDLSPVNLFSALWKELNISKKPKRASSTDLSPALTSGWRDGSKLFLTSSNSSVPLLSASNLSNARLTILVLFYGNSPHRVVKNSSKLISPLPSLSKTLKRR